MNTNAYNKSASRQGSFVHEQVIAPVRGAACNKMISLLDYDPNSGQLRWRFCSWKTKAWNKKYAGIIAGSRKYRIDGNKGAIEVKSGGVTRAAHRLIWEMLNGPIPDGFEIDHVNGDPFDNRIQNIRLATPSQNQWNKGVQSNNTSGYKGVSKNGSGWRIAIQLNGITKRMGGFRSAEEAAAAYAKLAKENHGAFARF